MTVLTKFLSLPRTHISKKHANDNKSTNCRHSAQTSGQLKSPNYPILVLPMTAMPRLNSSKGQNQLAQMPSRSRELRFCPPMASVHVTSHLQPLRAAFSSLSMISIRSFETSHPAALAFPYHHFASRRSIAIPIPFS